MKLTAYLQEHYGRCSATHCRCRCDRKGCSCGGGRWLGTECPYWQPTTASTYEELAAWQGLAQP